MAADDSIKGFIIGGLIGAALGILLAPKSGKETRDGIRNSAEGLLEKAKAQYEEVSRKIEDAVDQKKELLLGKKRRVEEAVEAGLGAYKQGAEH